MSADITSLLILANSGRSMAESALRGGYRVTVLDGYCDQDTLAVADCWPVSCGFAQLDGEALQAEMASLFPEKPCGVIYGAGLEGAPSLLRRIAGECRLLGNDPSVFEILGDPERFFSLLERLRIPHPEVRFNAPSPFEACVWLVKRATSCGGQGVGYYSPGRSAHGLDHYYQRYLEGRVMSVLFIADGIRHRTIGYNRLSTAQESATPFLYGGAIGQAALMRPQRRRLERMIEKLVDELQLRGVNSLDFILNDDGLFILELNARPTATLELYEHLLPEGWIRHHVQACLGTLPTVPLVAEAVVRGHQVVYARHTIEIPELMDWPAWAKDRPAPGALIAAGQPLCSLYAEGADAEAVESLLQARQEEILKRLTARQFQPAQGRVAV